VVYIHGIANKPVASVLKCQWDTALFSTQLGDRSRMAYWVNRDRYPTPSDETCGSPDSNTTMSAPSVYGLSLEGLAASAPIDEEIKALTPDTARQAFLKRIADKMEESGEAPLGGISTKDTQAKILPLPKFLRDLIARQLTKAFLVDVHDFLFDKEKRDRMEQTLIDRLEPGGGPFVVIAHSQGSMIAYDVLRRLDPNRIKVPLFVTIGSPLGIKEVQDALKEWTGGTLPFPRCVTRWVNVADRLDPVAADPQLDNDYQGKIDDFVEVGLNPASPRHPHSASGYLSTEFVRGPVREAVGTGFPQAIAPFAIAKDLVAELEDGRSDERHEVLVQLSRDGASKPGPAKDLASIAASVEAKIDELMSLQGFDDVGPAAIERLRHFVVARLNRLEVEALRSSFKDLKIDGIWRNAAKRALIMVSTHTIQARPANLGYGADGKHVAWAVLDTGIRSDHPHFEKHGNVVEQWDCTKFGSLAKPASLKESAELDRNGHGTHVAGIIAGELDIDDKTAGPLTIAGMAPRCSLYGFKVLDDNGSGQDSWIIKALDKVAEINESAGQLVIHGVNLSLGGGFDPSVFGCGHTPLCQELRRLWRQGVLVCLAAGNEGYAVIAGAGGDIQANLDLSIGDPANLDEAIAVGSVHKTNPHTYGISYFSSRGPTADGRRKPDVVAPGEKILSARHDWASRASARTKPKIETHYVEMSGTSMATPHVSGLLAAFLSLRAEFISYPDRVKAMLLDGCVDLHRDPYAQGAGLPNLIKMLALN
jgi:subtilisin family serine protease